MDTEEQEFDLNEETKSAQSRMEKTKLFFKTMPQRVKSFFSETQERIKKLTFNDIKAGLISAVYGIKPFVMETSGDLSSWSFKNKKDILRFLILFFLLFVLFSIAASLFYFQANDAFISFRYVSNAMKGWGFVWNPPPFTPTDGYTSLSWLMILEFMWKYFGILPPHAADTLTYLFSMGTVLLCFAFIRRMSFPETLKGKSLWIFLLICFILITNRTFLAFMSSGTEAAMFNFLALWWTYEATSKTRNPLWFSFAAILLALTRLEGILFIPATAVFLIIFMFQKRGVFKCLLAFAPFLIIKYYADWRIETYGEIESNLYLMLFNDYFPSFGWDYLFSFIIEYGLYFWGFVFLIWALFKCLVKRKKDLLIPGLITLTFGAYAAYYTVVIGGDILEFKPFGLFIPLMTLAGVRMITENISRNFRILAGALVIYMFCSLPIPWTHYFQTKDLTTRKQTTFLYSPVSSKIGFMGFPVRYWENAQKRLIYQGVGLRHQEHKVLSKELLSSFPNRETGEKIKTEHRRLLAWNFVGVAGWVLPETYIIDMSGQNDWIIARTFLRNPARRLMGHDRSIPQGYIECFNGGTNLRITPFDGTPDVTFLPAAYLKDSIINGCESFWRSQAKTRQYKEIKLREK